MGESYSNNFSLSLALRQRQSNGIDVSVRYPVSIIRGLTEENTSLGIVSPIVYFKSSIGDILSDQGLVICSLILLDKTYISLIPNSIYYPHLETCDHQ